MPFGLHLAIEAIIDDEIQGCREVRHVAAKRLIGIRGNLQAVEVQSVVGSEEGLEVGVFVALLFSSGEGLVAHGIHHVAAVLANHLATLLV